MSDYVFKFNGLDQLEAAIRRNPAYTVARANVFITRGLAEYRRVIYRNPWRVGGTGGGAPVATGNLRDTHQQTIQALEGRIYPTASYAQYVHEGTRYMRARPWLAYAADTADAAVRQHEGELLDDLLSNLAA